MFIGGAVVQWLRDGLKAIAGSGEVQALAESVPDAGGVMFVPAFTGLGAPYWNADARGAIVGLTRGSTVAHIARATLESIAFQSAALLQAMSRDAGSGCAAVAELRVDGGACVNNLLMQFQADLLGIPVVRPKVVETTALGAAYLAGLAVGVYENLDELAAQWQVERTLPADDAARAGGRVDGAAGSTRCGRRWQPDRRALASRVPAHGSPAAPEGSARLPAALRRRVIHRMCIGEQLLYPSEVRSRLSGGSPDEGRERFMAFALGYTRGAARRLRACGPLAGTDCTFPITQGDHDDPSLDTRRRSCRAGFPHRAGAGAGRLADQAGQDDRARSRPAAPAT